MQEIVENVPTSNAFAIVIRMEPEVFKAAFTLLTMMLSCFFNEKTMEASVLDLCPLLRWKPVVHLFEHYLKRVSICFKIFLSVIVR